MSKPMALRLQAHRRQLTTDVQRTGLAFQRGSHQWRRRVRRLLTPHGTPGWIMLIATAWLLAAVALFSRVRAPVAVLAVAFALPALALALAVMLRVRLGWMTIGVILAGLVLYGTYFGYTDYGERNFDGGAQLEYIRYIVDHEGGLPSPNTCFVCHHPPVYYATAAATYGFLQWTHLYGAVRGAQLVSLFATFVFLLFGALTVRRFVQAPRLVALATALVAFWPYTIVNSVRLHNDTAVGAVMVAGQFFLVRWYQENKPRDLAWASALASLALLTKSNGIALIATVFVIVVYQLVKQPGRLAMLRRAALPLFGVVAVAAAFTMYRRALEVGDVRHGMLGTAYEIGAQDFTPNEPADYLYFDLETFIREPYVMARTDGTGREHYWNHVLKSSLFSTHNTVADAETSYRWNRRIAEVMSALFLGMVVYGGAGILLARRDSVRRYSVLGVGAAMLFGLHIAFKATVPSGHHADFRFVYPVIVPGSVALVKVIEAFDVRGLVLGTTGKGLASLFIALSILYYVPKHDFVLKHLPRHVLRRGEAALRAERPEQTPFDDARNVLILSDEVLEVELNGTRKVSRLELSLDHNDRYAVELVGKAETRTIVFGSRADELKRVGKPTGEEATSEPTRAVVPARADGATASEAPEPGGKPKKELKPTKAGKKNDKAFKGLAVYSRDVDPPVEGVHYVRVRPLSGDRLYALGHLVVK
jgi:hypothetical protein